MPVNENDPIDVGIVERAIILQPKGQAVRNLGEITGLNNIATTNETQHQRERGVACFAECCLHPGTTRTWPSNWPADSLVGNSDKSRHICLAAHTEG